MTTATSLNDHTALEGILRCHQIRPIRYSRACAVEDNALYCGSSHPSSSRFSSKDGVRRERGRCEQLSISRAHYVIFGWTRFGTSSVNKSRPDKLGWSISQLVHDALLSRLSRPTLTPIRSNPAPLDPKLPSSRTIRSSLPPPSDLLLLQIRDRPQPHPGCPRLGGPAFQVYR